MHVHFIVHFKELNIVKSTIQPGRFQRSQIDEKKSVYLKSFLKKRGNK